MRAGGEIVACYGASRRHVVQYERRDSLASSRQRAKKFLESRAAYLLNV